MKFDLKKESEMFDRAAEYYDRYRPGYPTDIIRAFVQNAHLTAESKTLEIGAGSGKATELLTEFGFSIQCVEVGENLVQNGQMKFKNNKNISFECGRFENLTFPEASYDAIFAAQAFHWIPQPEGYEKCAKLLKKNGFLAPFWNMYLCNDSEEDQELLHLSRKYGGFADFVQREKVPDRIEKISDDIENSGFFSRPKVFRSYWEKRYTAEEYYGFVQTGNRFLQLPQQEKENAYRDLLRYEERYQWITRPYLTVLYLAQVRRNSIWS